MKDKKCFTHQKTSFSFDEEKKLEVYAEILQTSNLVEDIKFREIAKSKEAIQEILRVILDEDDLIVLESAEQKNMSESIFHGVILDCLCRLSDGELVNIEMQIEFRNAPIKRMRYNQSAMTIAHSPKDKLFDYNKIPRIITIMFCEFDIFGLNEPIYEIKRKVNDTDVVSDNGVREIYVNLTAKAPNEKLEELFSIFTKLDYYNKQMYPVLSETKEKYSDIRKGGKTIMSGLTREIFLDGYESGEKLGTEKGREEGFLKAYVDIYKKGFISTNDAANMLGISEEEFIELTKK